ncbi:MAG: hypothetical protein GZ088_12145 [Acidipila sp.]|nr:hypothetical protein [Acidipila sp.]
MSSTEPGALERECEGFCHYLMGRAPDAYVLAKYAEAHRLTTDYSRGSRFDRLLVSFAAWGSFSASLADSYASLFARQGILRRKLVLLLAILESSSPAHGFLDAIEPTPVFLLALQLLGRGILFGIRVLAISLVLLPLQLALGGSPPRGE